MFERTDGDGAGQLAFVIRKYGYNKDIDLQFATVTAPLPGIKIKLDKSGLELDSSDVIVSHTLTEHTRKLVIDGVEKTVTVRTALKANDRVAVLSMDQVYFISDKVVE
ncbi:DUF2577 family protein [Cytobacillus oceanisediminis]|uniref:Uncharacterized protein n=1 Tax=Cytobacillus oceanisediminis 2691 TaxID=1196031 RepID=A0A160MAQ2_9BACI|nr:DUF2577 family protein [Cytobacillus oceanisediminis]AND39624.1 hypothetical protein A361_10905 [Cytobacillus oceanisediminis 2691]